MAQSAELIAPSEAFQQSYRGLVAEFVAAGEKLIPFTLAFEHADFNTFLARLDACSKGIGLPDGFVAHTTYWLVRNQIEVVGVSNIRHTLTSALRREGGNIGYGIRPSARGHHLGTEILRQSLQYAIGLGLTKVLLTCSKSNVASIEAMLENGAVFDSEEYLPERGEVVRRYWIQLAANGRA